MNWTSGEHKISVDISYLSSHEEAAKQIRYNLATIQIPAYKSLANVGDEAYLIKPDGPVMLRKANVVITVYGCSEKAPVKDVEQFAARIADAIEAG